jgi:hypothetical protein
MPESDALTKTPKKYLSLFRCMLARFVNFLFGVGDGVLRLNTLNNDIKTK